MKEKAIASHLDELKKLCISLFFMQPASSSLSFYSLLLNDALFSALILNFTYSPWYGYHHLSELHLQLSHSRTGSSEHGFLVFFRRVQVSPVSVPILSSAWIIAILRAYNFHELVNVMLHFLGGGCYQAAAFHLCFTVSVG